MLCHTVIKIFEGLIDDGRLADVTEVHAGLCHNGPDTLDIEWFRVSVSPNNIDGASRSLRLG